MKNFKVFPKIPLSKRCLDLLLSSLGIIILSPIFLVIALLTLILNGKPIYFLQNRPGYRGEVFTIIKFRTMKSLKSSDGHLLPDEKRLTKFGKFLRATSLDELPELLNVLRGDMSLVGPRPLLIEYLPLYNEEQTRRHDTLPGITGWAQINGRNNISWQEKFKLDVWYVDHWSFWLDIKILFLTIWKVLKREGVSEPGQASSKLFTGNN